LNKFRQDIAQFDIPASQILLDLLLVELTDTTAEQLGLSLQYSNDGRGLNVIPGLGSATFRALTTLPKGFSGELRALEEQGKARVRANPRIATVSGRNASIFVGRQRYVATPLEGGRNFIDAGVRLNVTPYTGGEKQVLITADAEVSTLSAPDPATRLPEKSTRTASTTVRVNDGQTIVIGGLKQQESRDIRTRVPLLGSLPLIGSLFRTKDVRTTNTELVLFITPRILSDTGHLPAAEEKSMQERFLSSDLSQPLPEAPASAFTIPPGVFSTPIPPSAATGNAPTSGNAPTVGKAVPPISGATTPGTTAPGASSPNVVTPAPPAPR
jgi:type II secretory pathway component GspD/PulD (secretin)